MKKRNVTNCCPLNCWYGSNVTRAKQFASHRCKSQTKYASRKKSLHPDRTPNAFIVRPTFTSVVVKMRSYHYPYFCECSTEYIGQTAQCPSFAVLQERPVPPAFPQPCPFQQHSKFEYFRLSILVKLVYYHQRAKSNSVTHDETNQYLSCSHNSCLPDGHPSSSGQMTMWLVHNSET